MIDQALVGDRVGNIVGKTEIKGEVTEYRVYFGGLSVETVSPSDIIILPQELNTYEISLAYTGQLPLSRAFIRVFEEPRLGPSEWEEWGGEE